MKKFASALTLCLLVSVLLFSCASSSRAVPFSPFDIKVVNNTIQEMNIAYGVNEGSQPLPYPTKVKTNGTISEASGLDLYIVHTNDVHGRMDSADGGMGYSALLGYVNALRNASKGNVLLLDAGDVSHGTNLANFFKGETVMNLLGYMGYDAITLGNHEFNNGLQQLDKNLLIALARDTAPVSNNIKLGGKRILPPYKIFDFSGFKVGVIGLTTPSTKNQANPLIVKDLDFETSLQSDLLATVNDVKSKADYVIVLGHIGLEPVGTEGITSLSLAKNVPGIDLFVDGHSHSELNEPLYEGTTPIVQTGEYLNNVGTIKLHIDSNKNVTSFDAYLISKDEIENPSSSTFLSSIGLTEKPSNAAVEDYITKKKARLEEVYLEPVARLNDEYKSDRSIVRAEQCDLGKLVVDALTESVGADFGILNGGSFRANLGPGVVTVGNINNCLPFNNYVVLSSITGEGLYAALENGYKSYPELAGGFPQTNLLLEVDTNNDPGSRIISVALPDGTAIEKDDTVYKVATNDFIVAGGDGYTQFGSILQYKDQVNQVVMEYLKAKYPL